MTLEELQKTEQKVASRQIAQQYESVDYLSVADEKLYNLQYKQVQVNHGQLKEENGKFVNSELAEKTANI